VAELRGLRHLVRHDRDHLDQPPRDDRAAACAPNGVRHVDHTILLLNLALLLCIGVLPFATSLLASYLRSGHGQGLAAAIYGGAFLLMSIAFSALNRHILFEKAHMLRGELTLEQRRKIITRGVVGLLPYVLATALAPVSPYATLAICAVVAGFYALPLASGGDVDPLMAGGGSGH
jgi:uncharacterized membrane protein